MSADDQHPYRDPDHPWNSAQYHTGKPCVEAGCDKPAGTAWGPYWCQAHNAERIDRISASLESIQKGMGNK